MRAQKAPDPSCKRTRGQYRPGDQTRLQSTTVRIPRAAVNGEILCGPPTGQEVGDYPWASQCPTRSATLAPPALDQPQPTMPLFLSKTGAAPTVLTKDKDRILSYTLTADGAKQLRAAGIRNGHKIPARVLASLIRSGQAHSPHLAESQGQVRFDFASDDTSDFLPRCEMTGVTSDVHLVVYGEGNGTRAVLCLSPGELTISSLASQPPATIRPRRPAPVVVFTGSQGTDEEFKLGVIERTEDAQCPQRIRPVLASPYCGSPDRRLWF